MALRYNTKEYRVGALEMMRRFSTPALEGLTLKHQR